MLCAFLCSTSLAQQDLPRLVGTVTKVVDGDTVDVLLDSGPIRVRLHAVDAPERGQPGGREATEELRALVMGKEVELVPVQQDRYDRLVAKIFVGEMDVNAELVRRGYAWAARQYMTKDDAVLCELESEVRAARRGLWASKAASPVAPWEWRRRKNLTRFTNYARETVRSCIAAIGRR